MLRSGSTVRRAVRARPALAGLLGVLAAGALLRALFFVAWRPAFMGWPDAKSYIDVAHGDLFGSVLRPVGYPLFLRLLEAVGPDDIRLVIVANHLLGLAAAAVLYATVARAGGPRALGLLPAAVVALNGDGVFLEHSPLSEPLFIFLVVVGLYAAVRTLDAGGSALWPWACGLALATAGTVRVVGLVLLPVVALWLLLTARGTGLSRRVLPAAAATVVALSVLGVYHLASYQAIGQTGLSRHGDWHLYGRVAPFADCGRFTPPPGTEPLCEDTPRQARAITDAYIFNWWYSPAVRTFGDPHITTDAASAQVGAFARAAVIAQPLDYLSEVGVDMLRYVAPENDWLRGVGGGPSYADLVGEPILFHRGFAAQGLGSIREHYGWEGRRFAVRRDVLAVLKGYERVTRIQGPLMVLLAALSLAGPVLLRGRPRAVALLLALAAWALLVGPVAALEFSARTAVPGFGLLGAAAALGGWAVAMRVRARGARVPAPTRTAPSAA